MSHLLRTSFFIAITFLLSSACGAEEAKPVPADHAEKMARGLELFKTSVRDTLILNCVECHGGEETESEFDLTTRDGLLQGGEIGPAVIVGQADKSELMKLIRHQKDPKMPDEDEMLPDDDIAAISKWIDLGAPYDSPLVEKKDPAAWTAEVLPAKAKEYWAFQPLAETTPPKVKNEAWCKTPIDHFILAAQEKQGLTPTAPVSRRRLIRRVYFDLIGLPPTPAEIEAFVADKDPKAYSSLIDRLLASEHYGERWGRHWLDVARFAESHGFEQDYDRKFAFHFRDFVIQALNQDMPFEQFVRWQIAGDEIAPDDPLAMKATGFLGAGVFPTQITKNEVERTRYDAIDDMTSTTASAMLGMTLGCSRCHDHKYDPLPMVDYYRFASTFTTTVRSNIDLKMDDAEYQKKKAAFDKTHQPLVAALTKYEQEQLPQKLAAWEKTSKASVPTGPQWFVLDITSHKSKGGAIFKNLGDGSLLAEGKNAALDTYTFTAQTDLENITGIKIEALAHPSMPRGGPGRANNGNFALTDFKVSAAPKNGKGKAVSLAFQNPQSTFDQKGLAFKNVIDSDGRSAWAVDPQFGKDHAGVLETQGDVGFPGGTILTFTLKFENNTGHNIGRPRLSVTGAARPVGLKGSSMPATVLAALAKAADKRSPQETTALSNWYKSKDAEWQKLNAQVQAGLSKSPKQQSEKVMVCSEGVKPIRHHTQGADFFNETYFLVRGDTEKKVKVATQSFLQVLMNSDNQEQHWQQKPPAGVKTSYRRTALANWLVDTDKGAGHLLARVIVNRLWQQHFGRGIVSTPNDFGKQGDAPTHPQLLDHLATTLIADDWSLKKMHHRMLTSAVYLQGTSLEQAKVAKDPLNQWHWRRSPRRLEAEAIRDSMLAVSGSLDRRMFGAGTLDEKHRRRSIYFMIKRSKLIPTMQLFDSPEPLVSVGNRPSTTIAPQALLFLNSPNVRSYANTFADQLSTAASQSPAEGVKQGYLKAIGREPTTEELNDDVAFLAEQSAAYKAAGKNNGTKLALADFCQMLLSLNEFVYVE